MSSSAAFAAPGTSASEIAPLTSMASAMFFGTCTFATVALALKSMSAGGNHGDPFRAIKAANNPRATALDVRSFLSVYTLLQHTSIFGLIMFYAYVCEYHPPYAHAEKNYDRDEFFFLTALLILVSLFTLHVNDPHADKKNMKTQTSSPSIDGLAAAGDALNGSSAADGKVALNGSSSHTCGSAGGTAGTGIIASVNDHNEVLNRDQTEEWKGWMQFMFLLYHYYHAEEVYNAIRIMITCYVWMTGFGNFSFFYLTGDFGSVRVLQMLWRLNFLVLFLVLTQGTTYILYYICLLHTYFFMMVYVTMRTASHVNYTKWGIRIKMFCLAIIIFCVWDLDLGLFRLMHWPFLGEKPMLGASEGAMWEWYFRSSLDHWSTYLGMCFALNFPITSLFFRKLEAQPFATQWAAKGAMGAGLFALSYWWVTGPFQQGKFDYNQTNAYFGWIPMITYIYFRNMTPWLRSNSLDLLHQIGKTTLETYLMQHHIWLTSNAKSLLTLIPGWPKMNFLIVTCIYFILSRRLYQLTLFLRGMMLPNDRNACLRNLAGMFAVLFSYVALAVVLKTLDILNLFTVFACSVGCGMLLYQAILDRTWATYANEPSGTHGSSSGSVAAKSGSHGHSVLASFSLSAGTVAVVFIGLVWHHMATTGAGKIKTLPPTCRHYVKEGHWIPVDACNGESRGAAYRDYNAGALGSCLPQSKLYAWGWDATPSNSHCRLVQRQPKELLKTLNKRRVVFVGDSVLRHLYHAMRRQVGDKTAGAYNTTLDKWTDLSSSYKKTALEFKWGPYTGNLTKILQSIRAETNKADLVVLGGGAWDRLHIYGTDQEKEVLHSQIGQLAVEIEKTISDGIPVVWTVPTTINTWALQTSEKRAMIREDQMAQLRDVYDSKGVLVAATFVLDGQIFTRERVAESYDGVHYPMTVYDAGAQILANALDWLLPDKDTSDPFKARHPGAMAHPALGFMMLCLVFICCFLFDGFLGFSYLAGIFAPNMMPLRLFEESFTDLHLRKKLPVIDFGGSSTLAASVPRALPTTFREEEPPRKADKSSESGEQQAMDDEELQSFLKTLDDEEKSQNSRSSKASVK